MLVRLCSKSFKLGSGNMWTENFQVDKLDLEKAEEPEIKLPTFIGSQRKQRNSRKTSTSASWPMIKPLTAWITTNCEKILESDSESCSVMSDSLWPHGLYSPWNSPGQNIGVGSLSLLQGIFPTQVSNPGLSHSRWFFTSWAKGKPLRDANGRSSFLSPEKPVCQSRSNSSNQTWKNWLFQNWKRSLSRLYIVTLLI